MIALLATAATFAFGGSTVVLERRDAYVASWATALASAAAALLVWVAALSEVTS